LLKFLKNWKVNRFTENLIAIRKIKIFKNYFQTMRLPSYEQLEEIILSSSYLNLERLKEFQKEIEKIYGNKFSAFDEILQAFPYEFPIYEKRSDKVILRILYQTGFFPKYMTDYSDIIGENYIILIQIYDGNLYVNGRSNLFKKIVYEIEEKTKLLIRECREDKTFMGIGGGSAIIGNRKAAVIIKTKDDKFDENYSEIIINVFFNYKMSIDKKEKIFNDIMLVLEKYLFDM